MKNEERVKYIEDRLDQYCVSNGSMNDRFVMSAFAYAIRQEAINEMNNQFKEYLVKLKNELFATERDVNSSLDLSIWHKTNLLNTIINKLFGE